MTTTDIKWLTTTDLQNIIQRNADKQIRDAFLGIFAINELPSHITRLPVLLIINTNTGNLPGQHWKAIFIGRDATGEVFDSLSSPVSLRLQQWMNRHTKKWTTSKLVLQNPLAPTCGAYVLYFVLNRLYCNSLSTCVSLFSPNVKANDAMMLQYFTSLSHK